MKDIPQMEESPRKLFEMLYGAIKAKLLTAGIRLGVFDHLTEPLTAARAARALESDPLNTEYFLNGLTACGLLEKKGGVYTNTPLARDFLVQGKPTYLGKGFLMQSARRDMVVKDLYKLVKNGPPPDAENRMNHSEEDWGRMAGFMANMERAGIAQQMAATVSGLPEFLSFRTMLDLGGGPGIFGIAMVLAHPTMKGVVFDRQPSTDAAQKFIAEYGLQDRMDVLPGDYNKDPLGGPYDFIWASNTLNFAQPDLDLIMAKIYGALNPGGVFINTSEGLTHESTQPEFTVLCSMAWSMHNHPLRAFDRGVIAEAMLRAGFRSVRSTPLDTGWGSSDMDIARK